MRKFTRKLLVAAMIAAFMSVGAVAYAETTISVQAHCYREWGSRTLRWRGTASTNATNYANLTTRLYDNGSQIDYMVDAGTAPWDTGYRYTSGVVGGGRFSVQSAFSSSAFNTLYHTCVVY
jgi:hypothetical protein